ncbi:hypothetical protein JY651_50620 [Pyxidicoccus parkwayensis]|uniref:Uncharacterized protein n=1 Tax=Pyxidicoccus parkwayensis TaxID=2813578 RepID=A0ABX7NXX9_9BACT|nr:hypothetical protein [Pyxidicoccus parkwaysis]QSQ23244.1 hypothetical protein JY651_50620 [Pyxidicoccus parkwaysis]
MSIHSAADRAVRNALASSQNLSEVEEKSLKGLSGQDYERAKAQLMLQKQQETVAFITKLLKDQGAMDVIGNVK